MNLNTCKILQMPTNADLARNHWKSLSCIAPSSPWLLSELEDGGHSKIGQAR